MANARCQVGMGRHMPGWNRMAYTWPEWSGIWGVSIGQHGLGWNGSPCGRHGSVHARLAGDSICQVGIGLEVLGLNGTAYARLAQVSTCGAGRGQHMPGWQGSVHAGPAWEGICQVGRGQYMRGRHGTAYARLAGVSACGAGMGWHMPGWNESRCARSRWDSICQVGVEGQDIGVPYSITHCNIGGPMGCGLHGVPYPHRLAH